MEKGYIKIKFKGIENNGLVLRSNTNQEMINEQIRGIFSNDTPQFDYIRNRGEEK